MFILVFSGFSLGVSYSTTLQQVLVLDAGELALPDLLRESIRPLFTGHFKTRQPRQRLKGWRVASF